MDGDSFFWSVGHDHQALGNGRYQDCRDTLSLRLARANGRLLITFPETSGTPPNLNRPGTARALLDEARAQGWQPARDPSRELDGWSLLEAAATRRTAAPNS
ncbi:hypothetical protein GXW82_38950 [Streptacidiphilus sp. 4-A2]|nr:hypothetical protein [Streptacidiphilus sp. 4-A2]